MTIGERLREERERMGMSQPKFAALAGTTKQTLFSWESGKTSPDGFQFAALDAAGADVRYIITGDRDSPLPEVLSSDERYLLEQYRGSPPALRNAALRVLLGGEVQRPPKIKIDGKVTGQVVEGGLVNNGPVSFGSKGRVKKK